MDLPDPSKLVCFARTFPKHARELGNPVPSAPIFFIKPNTTVIATGQAILLPAASALVHYEAEAAVVIGARIHRATEAEAEAAIAAWTVLNDVTARDLQRADGGRFSRAKGFDTFCPVAPQRAPNFDWRTGRVQGYLNGKLKQDGALADLLFSPAHLVAWASAVMTLLPGDIVSFGTPPGVGQLVADDVLETRLLDGVGRVVACTTNPVARAPETSEQLVAETKL